MRIKKTSKQDWSNIALAIFLLALLLLIYSAINNPQKLISRELSDMGYSVESLEIQRISVWHDIYKSSIVVKDKSGRDIEYWQIEAIPGFQTISHAVPYWESDKKYKAKGDR